ncbi:MAG: peptidylprolyl isomerase [Bacteroidota bacterium]
MKTISATVLAVCLSLGVVVPAAASVPAKPRDVTAPKDLIARVGNQTITFGEIETMINSSDMVGMPIPAPGTSARNHVRLMLLDKMISANLLYLDALKQGAQNNPVYQQDMERFSKAMLAALYREKKELENIKVTDKEIRDYYKNNIVAGTPFTPEVRMGIEATIRKERFTARKAAFQKELRQGVAVAVDQARLDPKGDAARASNEVVASVDRETIGWGELRAALTDPRKSENAAYRGEILNDLIDQRIAASKAKAAGLDKSPVYLDRIREFGKVHLVSMYKAKLLPGFEPTDKAIQEYFAKNKENIAVPESRKIQMVVLKTKKEADDVKKQITSGKITLFEAASKYSIDPNAKQTLGEFGWVAKGSGFPDLDRLVFSLKPDELGGPVQSPAGWHLVKVLDSRNARFNDIKSDETQKLVRNLLMHERQNEYVTGLRTNNVFPVKVYQETFQRIVRREAEKMEAKRKKADKAEKKAEKAVPAQQSAITGAATP